MLRFQDMAFSAYRSVLDERNSASLAPGMCSSLLSIIQFAERYCLMPRKDC